MRVARLQRVIARFYKQALRAARLTQPQMEALTILLSTAGPVSPAALAARLMLERSTISRNLAPCRKGRVAVVGTSATGRAMSVTITDRQIRQRTTRVARAAQKHAAGTPAGRQD